MESCLFCRIARKEIPAKIVRETPEWLAFEDISPRAPTHLLVIPREHVETLDDLGDDHAPLAGSLLLAARDLARERGIAKRGYRVVLNCREEAGQSVFHLHLHLLGGRAMAWPPG